MNSIANKPILPVEDDQVDVMTVKRALKDIRGGVNAGIPNNDPSDSNYRGYMPLNF